jgi:hypothetical protein
VARGVGRITAANRRAAHEREHKGIPLCERPVSLQPRARLARFLTHLTEGKCPECIAFSSGRVGWAAVGRLSQASSVVSFFS